MPDQYVNSALAPVSTDRLLADLVQGGQDALKKFTAVLVVNRGGVDEALYHAEQLGGRTLRDDVESILYPNRTDNERPWMKWGNKLKNA